MLKDTRYYLGSLLEALAWARGRYAEITQEHPTSEGRVAVSLVSFTREYGGPEEGGWWYDLDTEEANLVASSSEDLLAAVRLFYKQASDLISGDPSSVRGGVGVRLLVWVEGERRAWKEEEGRRPRYE